jgi:hypothetical protein
MKSKEKKHQWMDKIDGFKLLHHLTDVMTTITTDNNNNNSINY